jgi:hypothetical protein
MLTVLGMKVGRKRLTSGIRTDAAGPREDVLRALPGQPEVDGVGTQVDVPRPLKLAVGTELDLSEHTFLIPDGEHAFARQVRQVHLTLGPVLITQPDAVPRERSNLYRADDGH